MVGDDEQVNGGQTRKPFDDEVGVIRIVEFDIGDERRVLTDEIGSVTQVGVLQTLLPAERQVRPSKVGGYFVRNGRGERMTYRSEDPSQYHGCQTC